MLPTYRISHNRAQRGHGNHARNISFPQTHRRRRLEKAGSTGRTWKHKINKLMVTASLLTEAEIKLLGIKLQTG